jgi:hypothetical protein
MSERMKTDDLRKNWNLILAWCGVPKVTAQAAAILDEVADEMERARRVEQEQAGALKAKDETIKALADALEDQAWRRGQNKTGTVCFCINSDGRIHTRGCETATSALRLAGRLP